MAWVGGALMAGGSILSGLIGSGASQSAANTQAGAATQASANQMSMFNTINAQQAPWRQAGQNALNQIGTMNPQFTHTFDAQDLNTNLAPNYAWQLGQGQGALQNQYNASGGLISGNTLKGMQDYTQNFAGNAYQQAFNNYNSQQTNIFNRLSNIAGLGQTANQTTANAGQNAALASSNFLTSGAAAQAAGTVGTANAISGGINNAMGWNYLSSLGNQGSANTQDAIGNFLPNG